jgi:hypothetical protein
MENCMIDDVERWAGLDPPDEEDGFDEAEFLDWLSIFTTEQEEN